MPKTLNVGMIGYKFMGRAHSNAWLKADKFFDLKARPVMKIICGRDKAGVSQAAYRWGWGQFVTDWREVVNDPTIDIIDINTPTTRTPKSPSPRQSRKLFSAKNRSGST